MTTPSEPPQHPRLAWLRYLGASLFGIGALTVIAMLQGALDGSPDLDSTRRTVVLVLIFGCTPSGVVCFWIWWRLSGRYDTAENFVDRPSAFAPPVSPDQASPDRVFVQGGYAFQLQLLPARAPLLLTRGSMTGDGGNVVFQILFEAATWFGSRALDRRWKVVVSRRLRAAGHLWSTLTIEFFDQPDPAAARLQEIIATWDRERYAALEPMTGAEIREARKRR